MVGGQVTGSDSFLVKFAMVNMSVNLRISITVGHVCLCGFVSVRLHLDLRHMPKFFNAWISYAGAYLHMFLRICLKSCKIASGFVLLLTFT